MAGRQFVCTMFRQKGDRLPVATLTPFSTTQALPPVKFHIKQTTAEEKIGGRTDVSHSQHSFIIHNPPQLSSQGGHLCTSFVRPNFDLVFSRHSRNRQTENAFHRSRRGQIDFDLDLFHVWLRYYFLYFQYSVSAFFTKPIRSRHSGGSERDLFSFYHLFLFYRFFISKKFQNHFCSRVGHDLDIPNEIPKLGNPKV